MVHGIFGSAKGIAAPRAGRRSLAVMVCLAGLAGCENLASLESGLRETFSETFGTSGEAAAKRSDTPRDSAAMDEVVVSLDRPAAKTLQFQLARLGFRPGPVDGIIGLQTARAIKRYQAAHGLPVTGTVTLRFLEHLEGVSESGTARTHTPVNLAAADYPAYPAGASFSYSNGETERVLSAKDGVVRWGRADGTSYSAHRNFLLPKLYWVSGNERGTARISGTADELWPVREGQEVSFSARLATQNGDEPDSTRRRKDQWRCLNEGERTVTVEAGTFESLVFVCRRGANPASPEFVRTWYYAKSIRHYVRYSESVPGGGATSTVDLVAIRPAAPGWPPIVRAALERAVVHALEMEGSHSRMPWTSSGVKTRVTIEATSRFVADDGRSCRRFVQIWSENGQRRHYPAVACKSAAGSWVIPGLPSQTANALATAGTAS